MKVNKLFQLRASIRPQTIALLTPYLLGTLILIVIPAGLSFFIAFNNYNGLTNSVFVGWKNFTLLRRDPLFWIALTNSLLFIAIAVPLRLLGALGLAMFYSRPQRMAGLYRAAVYVPTVIPDTAYALMLLWVLNPLYGPLNASLRTFGLPTPPWLVDSSWAPLAIVLVSLFQIGEGFAILLAALRHIPNETYDAARVDGANRWQMFDWITLPLITPWLVLLSVRDIVLSFQNTFTPAYIMTRGGPYYSTYYIPHFIYETAFDGMRFGEAAAVMMIVFIVTLLLILLVYFIFEGWGFDED